MILILSVMNESPFFFNLKTLFWLVMSYRQIYTNTQYIFAAINVIIYIVSCFIMAALIIYYGYKYYKHRDNIIIKKRYSNIVFIINASTLPMYLIAWPVVYFPLTVGKQLNDYAITWSVIYPYCCYTATIFTALRFFLIHYDIQFIHSSKNLQWKTYLTTDRKTLKKDNWYIQNRNSLGNSKKMIKNSFLIVFILATIQMILKLLQNNMTNNSIIYFYAASFMDITFYIG
eukprot:458192_1